MINHVRTLLLNMSRPGLGDSSSGEEYIDAAFSPLRLHGGLAAMQAVLVPAAGSRSDRNFRVNSLMALAHAPDFEKYTMAFDGRITYAPADFGYVSESSAAGAYPVSDLAGLYDKLVSAAGRSQYIVFDCPGFMDSYMSELKDVWYGNLSLKDRITAAVLAVAYRLERYRTYGI